MNDHTSPAVLDQRTSSKTVRPVIRSVRAETFHWGRRVVHDPKTGRELWQLTTGESTNHHPYFYRQPFTLDESNVVLASDRTGIFQLYLVNVYSGEARQLTFGDEVDNLGATTSADGTEVIYAANGVLYAIDLASGEQRTITSIRHLGIPHGGVSFTLNGDSSKAVLVYRKPDEYQACAIVDVRSGGQPEELYVFGKNLSICHSNFCPADSNLMTYVQLPDFQDDPQNPPEKRARTRILDLRTRTSRPFLTMPAGFRATHEYWDSTGERLFFHKKHVPNWTPASIGYMPREGGDLVIVYEDQVRKLGHSMINPQGTLIVSDDQTPTLNDLILIDVKSGLAETLCWPNASGRNHPNHIHPLFSRTGKFILYTSDESGFAQVFVIPLGR